ncbi:MAG: ABC transporter permease [Chloroflexota bacterium]
MDARIVDRGYQHYRGPRLGVSHALWTLVWAAARRVMGIRRPTTHKLAPWLLVVLAYGEAAIALVGARATGAQQIPYGGLYSTMAVLFALFAALGAPDLLCADRRERVLSLYFAAPITRAQYVLAQVAALFLLLLLFTLVPYLLLFASYAFLSPGVGSYLQNHSGDLWRIVVSGGLLALYYTAVALAIASFAVRRAYASGAFLGLLLVSSAAGRIISGLPRLVGRERFALVDLHNLPVNAVRWLFGEPRVTFSGESPGPGSAYLVLALLLIAGSITVMIWRYLGLRD